MSKYLENFCQEIKELISQIFGARQKLKEMAQVADQEGRRASGIFVRLLSELVREIAPIQIKEHKKQDVSRINNKYIQWHEEYGLATRTENQLEPLSAWGEDFPPDSIESLAGSVKNDLLSTLRSLNNKQSQLQERTEKFRSTIAILEKWEQEIAGNSGQES
jgi:hypothetical protein